MSLTVDVEIESTDIVVKRCTQALIDCGKVYLMTLTEQMEMDAFLEEALATGHIRQSKSPLGALVFFIKKKDNFTSSRTTEL
jgi:hypothetical protein